MKNLSIKKPSALYMYVRRESDFTGQVKTKAEWYDIFHAIPLHDWYADDEKFFKDFYFGNYKKTISKWDDLLIECYQNESGEWIETDTDINLTALYL